MVGYGFGFGFPEFAEDNCLPHFPFETFGWVGVLGFVRVLLCVWLMFWLSGVGPWVYIT